MVPARKPKQQKNPTQLVNEFGWDAQFAVPELLINPYESFSSDSSKHGAMLGRIASSQVVVKPHPNRNKAQRELANIEEFRAIGLNTFTPVGVFEGRNASYLVTEKYEGLTALNGLTLRIAHNDRHELKPLRVRTARSAQAAAEMHNKHATHGDYKVKNSFEGPNGETVFGDLENAMVGQRGRGDAVRRAADIYELGASLARGGYLYNKSPSYRAGAIGELVIGSYVNALDTSLDSQLDLVEAAIDYTIRTNRMEPFGRFAGGRVQL